MTHRILSLFVCVAILSTLTAQFASAQIVPWRTVGTGELDTATGDFEGTAQGIHLGRCTFSGESELFTTDDPMILEWWAIDTYVSANGRDKVIICGSGIIELMPMGGDVFEAVQTGTWDVIGGEGRFSNVGPADEPIEFMGFLEPFTFADETWFWSGFEKIGEFDLGRNK